MAKKKKRVSRAKPGRRRLPSRGRQSANDIRTRALEKARPRTSKPGRTRPLSRGQRNAPARRKGAISVAPPRKKAKVARSRPGGVSRVQRAVTRPATKARGRQRQKRSAQPFPIKARRPKPQQTRPVTHAVSKPPQAADLKYRLALIRKHVNGFRASDGYDARKLKDWTPRQIERVLTLSGKLKELLASPHDLKTARTQKARKNLKQFTGQNIRGQKHYIVHKPSHSTKVFLRDGNVELQGRFQGGVITRSRFYLFPRRSRYPNELVSMARRMLKSMPEGFYTVLTSAHGDTGEPFDKGQLINQLTDYLNAYVVDEQGRPTGFSSAVLGFRYMSTTLRGAEAQRGAVSARRERQREINKKKYQALKKAAKKRPKKKPARKK